MPVIALVPAYQAEATVGTVVGGLRDLWTNALVSGRLPAVIVVDDGSSDRTRRVAEAAGALVIRHDTNRGKGAALRSGLERARALGAEAVVTVDADGQHPPEEALRLALHPAPVEALVLGIRDLARDGAPRANRISNGISNFFLSAFTARRLRDTQCGLRRYPVAGTLGLGLVDDGYAFEAEALLRATRAGWALVEVPVRVVYPPDRPTHFHSVRDPAKIVRRVLTTLFDGRARPSEAS
jgi:glycosyltransferase involved in cell wall biosynthesis